MVNPNPAIKMQWNTSRDKKKDRKSPIRIIFARRLVPEKGTRLAVEVFKEILALYPNIEVTIAGNGDDKSFVTENFSPTHVSPSRPIMQNRRLYFIKTLTLPLCRRCAAKRPPSLSSKQCLPAALLLRRICLELLRK